MPLLNATVIPNIVQRSTITSPVKFNVLYFMQNNKEYSIE